MLWDVYIFRRVLYLENMINASQLAFWFWDARIVLLSTLCFHMKRTFLGILALLVPRFLSTPMCSKKNSKSNDSFMTAYWAQYLLLSLEAIHSRTGDILSFNSKNSCCRVYKHEGRNYWSVVAIKTVNYRCQSWERARQIWSLSAGGWFRNR